MRIAVILYREAKGVAGKVKPVEKIDLTLPHKIFVVFTYFGYIRDSQRGNA